MKNVLIDQNCKWLAKDENRELLKDFEKRYVVGEAMKQSSFDENCADFCVKNTCDFLTADPSAYTHFFKIKKIKRVEISRFIVDKDPNRYIYRMLIKDID